MSDPGTSSGADPGAQAWDDLARTALADENDDGQQVEIRQLLTFEVDSTPYAVPVERVREIVRIRPITPVPRVPKEVRGVISLRGEIVEVIDLRLRLALPPAEPVRSTRIIVVHTENGKVAGILVDAVREVSRVSEDSIRPATNSDTGSVEALCVRGEEFISLMDLDQVLEIHAEH
jgi:purine-binding chemotaxis protein CheW